MDVLDDVDYKVTTTMELRSYGAGDKAISERRFGLVNNRHVSLFVDIHTVTDLD
jgi:hypothetical protein